VKSTLKPLASEDVHHIQAAEGWLGLGNPAEAVLELEKIKAENREHPAVMVIRCSVHYAAKNWPLVFELANTLTSVAPGDPFGWLNRSHALHFMGRTQEAWDGLLPMAGKFKKLYAVPYDLACYAAVLGQLETAREWLEKAFSVTKEPAKLKLHAREDPDLKDLWK
jgi:hypothetical protein